MIKISDLLAVADAYEAGTRLEDVTLSHRLFADSKKLAALRAGADITVGRFNAAMLWLSDNWPVGAVWPVTVARPEPAKLPEAAE